MNILALTTALVMTTASGSLLLTQPAPLSTVETIDMPTIVVHPDPADRVVDFPAITVRPASTDAAV